jgi:hypothetical protein
MMSVVEASMPAAPVQYDSFTKLWQHL